MIFNFSLQLNVVFELLQLSGKETAFRGVTSGSTGLPKCVAISHNSFIYNVEQIKHPAFNRITRICGES